MNNNEMFLMLDLISLACGVYCFYTWIRLVIEGRLFKNGLLVPKEKMPEDCLDEEAYIAFTKPRLAVLAFATTIYGVLQILNNSGFMKPFLVGWISFLPLVFVLAVLIWYAVGNSKANREYFGI